MATITDSGNTIKVVNGSKVDYISKDGMSISVNGDYIFLEEIDGEQHRFLYTEITSPASASAAALAETIAGYIEESGGGSSGSLPEYTTAERDALSPTGAMIIFNTTTDLVNYYDGSEWVEIAITTAESLKHVSADQSITTNAATNITDLVFAVSASTKYRVRGFYRIGCNNTGGVKFATVVPNGATLFISHFGFTTNATTFSGAIINASGTLTGTAFCTVNSQNGWVKVEGVIEIGETAGDVQFQFASGTDTQTSTVHTESFISLTPVA